MSLCYTHQNVDLFWMAVEELEVKYRDIDKVDRKTRTVHMNDGTVLPMPDEWDVT